MSCHGRIRQEISVTKQILATEGHPGNPQQIEAFGLRFSAPTWRIIPFRFVRSTVVPKLL